MQGFYGVGVELQYFNAVSECFKNTVQLRRIASVATKSIQNLFIDNTNRKCLIKLILKLNYPGHRFRLPNHPTKINSFCY